MTEFFVDIQNLAKARRISPDHYDRLLPAVLPYCPGAASADIFLSSTQIPAGRPFDCVVLTKEHLFFARVNNGLSYQVASFKLFLAAAFIGQGFVLEAKMPQFRLMLADGTKMRFALDTSDPGRAQAGAELADKLARKGFFRG